MKRNILTDPDEFAALAQRIERHPFDRIHDRLEKRCSLILESAPVTETVWQRMWQQGSWGAALNAARAAQGRILDLLIAHAVEPNQAFRDRAVEELRDLIGWSTWVDPCHGGQKADLCTGEAAVAVTIALDWLGDDLAEADRARLVETLREKALRPYLAAVADGAWWYTTYNNWNAVVNGGVGMAALALSDEPLGRDVLTAARDGLEHFFDALGPDGGWDEGTGYWGYAMRYLCLFGEALARVEGDESVWHARGMDRTALFPLHFTPNGHAASFGDVASVPVHGALYLLARRFDRPEIVWWLDEHSFHHDVSTMGWSQAGLALLLRPDGDTPAPPELEPAKVFATIGWAAVADRWPRPGFYVACKTGDLAANHSQRDMNSLQLQVDGEMLLTDLGSPEYSSDYFSDARGEFYEVQARAHNTLTVAEHDHRIDGQGSILDSAAGKTWRWVACDSGNACGEPVHFVRHVVMLLDDDGAGDTLAVLDELILPMPARIDAFWHTHGGIDLDEDAPAGRIAGQSAAVHFRLAAEFPFELTARRHAGEGHKADRFLHAVARGVQQGMLLSVFAREPVDNSLGVTTDADGVLATVGRRKIRFERDKGGLKLAKVS